MWAVTMFFLSFNFIRIINTLKSGDNVDFGANVIVVKGEYKLIGEDSIGWEFERVFR